MILGIDPKVDYAFKWLFGNQKNTSILIHLLHAILNPAPEEQIAEIQILNPFTDKMALDEKLSILDIKARDQLGRQFNIEMQMLASATLKQRILYYWGKLYTEQLQSGQNYGLLKPTISICFVDGVLFPAVDEYHLWFQLMSPQKGIVLTDHLCVHFFELPKFQRPLEELTTPLESWLYFLRYAESLNPQSLPGSLDTPEMRQAMEVLMMLTRVDIQKEIYEGRLKARRDEQMRLTDTLAEGLAKGRAEGLAEGLAKGQAKGVLIGRIEFAQKLMRREMTPRAALEAMPTEELEAIAGQLEQELLAKPG
jgi:predicted transposase/invertase (TIGR01784 family)